MYWKGEPEPNIKTLFGEKSWVGSKNSPQYKTLDTIDGEPMEFEWNIFPRIHHIAAHQQSPRVHEQKWANPNNSKHELSSCRCPMTSYGDLKTMKRNVLLIPHLCLYSQKDFNQDVGHSSDLDQKQSGILLTMKDLEENGTRVAELMTIKFRESGHPIFRATSPFVPRNAQKQRRWENYQYTSVPMGDTTETIFRTLISVNQLSIYGAVSDFCDEYNACQARTGRPVLAGQSDPLFEPARLLMTTPTPSTESSCTRKLYCKSTKNEWKRLSLQDRVIKICIDAQLKSDSTSWQRTLKNSHNFTEPSDMSWVLFWREMTNQLTQKVGFKGTPKLDPVFRSHNQLLARYIWSGN